MNKEFIVDSMSNDILKDVLISKIASEIISPMEKEAGSGITAFGKALIGTDKRILKAEKSRIAEELMKKTRDPKLLEAKKLMARAEDMASNAQNHPRMQQVKENYENAVKHYQDISSKNDEILNNFVGSKAPLKVVSPSWYKAKAKNFNAKIGLSDAKKQYGSQRKRISEDIMREVDLARQNVKDLEKKHDITKLQGELNSVSQMHDSAVAKTNSARMVAGGIAGAGYGAHKLYKAKKQKENEVGPYMYSAASEEQILVEKIAESMLQGIIRE